ncbi:SDR family oxidoreductase [Micractinium conductrix]|uniref:SDR family oxidoreductase n=1 Tax=Micractinium conductrix TaxID=554055 RepID=A0A2P6V7K3_9CHLO|nr:SDR family oxidoreductase [Micractinium conductrix]|eukprot:PSC70067.1 SDR family oxidoreductase [Micractinium conductrix]
MSARPPIALTHFAMAQFATFEVAAAREAAVKGPRLSGRVCLVAGGSGVVGSGIVRALLLDGATVVAPLRRNDQIEQLRAECSGAPLENLMPVVVGISEDQYCSALVSGVLQKYGRLDHAVSCFGGFWEGGPLTEQGLDELFRVVGDCATPHFVFARHVLPALNPEPSSSLLFISGAAGERCLNADSSLYSVASSMLYGIILAAQAQFAEHPFRVNELRLSAFFKRHEELRGASYANWFGKKVHSNRKVGKLVVDALLKSGRSERIDATPERLDGISLTVARGGLRDKLCVVADASTTVGSGIVAEVLKEGATVAAALRSESHIEKLMEDCAGVPTERLFTTVVDLGDDVAVTAFLEELAVKHKRPIDHVVSVHGQFSEGGPLTEQPTAELRRVLADIPTAHFVVAKCALPLLNPTHASSFLFMSEGADVGNNFKDFYGKKAFSARKVGKLAVEALLASKHAERIVITSDRLDGGVLTV